MKILLSEAHLWTPGIASRSKIYEDARHGRLSTSTHPKNEKWKATEFQIWTRLVSAHPDLRQYKPLPIQHEDFQVWQYNNTPDALKVFQNPFDFAVPCQGWQDYSRREIDEKQCERNKQWMLLKAKNPTVLARLMELDYERLAQECATAVPGFRKGDLVKVYTDHYEK